MSYRPDPRTQEYRSLELFRGCSRGERRTLSRLGTRIDAPTGRTIARQGSRRQEFVLVIDGAAEVLRDGQVVAHLGRGDHCGEFTLVRGVPQPATVVATAPSVIDGVLDRRTAQWLTIPTTPAPMSPALAEW